MPETIGEAFVAVRPDTTGFAQRVNTEVGGAVTGVANTIKKQFLGLFAVAGATRFFSGAIAESQEAAKVGAQTEAVLKSTGSAANVTAGEIDRLATSLSEKNAVDDEAIQQGANLLLTFTRVRNEVGAGNDIFNQAVRISSDLATALGTDVTSASLQLGKALNDPIAGVTALQRAGVQLTQTQKDQIKAFVESGDILSAQKIILAELTTQVGGSAAAQATDLDRAGVAWKNFQESVGTALAPVVASVATAGTKVLTFLSTLVEDLGGVVTIGPAVVFAIGAIGIAMGSMLGPIGLVASALGGIVLLLQNIGVIGETGPENATNHIKRFATEIDKLDPDKAAAALERFAKSGDSVQQRLGPAAKELGAFIRLADESPAGAQKIIDGMRASGEATDVFERALARAIEGKRDDARASEEAAAANEQYLKSIEDIHDEVLALAGGQVGYEQSVVNVEKAQVRLNEAIAQYGFESPEARDAALDLTDAQISAAEAATELDRDTAELNATFAKSPEAIQAEIDKLREAQRLHPEIASSYDPIIAKLVEQRDLFLFLASLPPATPTVNVQVNGLEKVYEAIDLFRFLGGNTATVDPFAGLVGGIPGRASGGPVGPGTWMVGEEGPELLTLGANGRGHVTDAATTAQMVGGGATFDIDFNVVSTEPVAVAHETAGLMKAVEVAVGFS